MAFSMHQAFDNLCDRHQMFAFNHFSFNGPGPLVIRSCSDIRLIRYQILVSKLLESCQMPSDSQISEDI